MSRLWVMVDRDRRCGACSAAIPPRTWFVELRLPGVGFVPALVLLRCEACAVDEGAVGPPVHAWREEGKPS